MTQPPVNALQCDVAIFGSGIAGLAAALVAACEGRKVIVFEKDAQLGGTTATSGGVLWVPGNRQAEAAGIDDPLEDARRFLAGQIGAAIRPELVEAYLASGREALDYLAERTELKFDLVAAPDYLSDADGGTTTGRALSTPNFDGRLLGAKLALVRPPKPAFMVLGGLMVGRREIPLLMRPFSSWGNFTFVCGLLARHARDRLTHARGTRLLMGNALVARAVYSALQRDVRFVTGAPLVRLLRAGGRVTGAVFRHDGVEQTVHAACAVVLATGGMPHAAALRERYMPAHPHRHSIANESNVGEGAQAALQVGGTIDTQMQTPSFWTPASLARNAQGREVPFPYGHMDRGKPGAILVNRAGRRFVNESESYHEVVVAMFKAGALPPADGAFLLCDTDFIRRYGLGLVRPAPFPLRPHIRSGYLVKGRTLEALAQRLGVDPQGLAAEVARHNEFARTGKDLDFGKGETAFNRYNGDARGQPNPCLLPIRRGPFYALRMFPATLGSALGLRTDENANVLDASGTPIVGLYACGNDMGSVMRGAYPGPGITLGPGLVFAYRAMRHATHTPPQGDTP
ncbi:MAG: FAD-dependent oxidoreductase [Pseudomonadota bacterium]